MVSAGPTGVRHFAFALRDARHVDGYRNELEAQGLATRDSQPPLPLERAFEIVDPDNNVVIFGVARESRNIKRALPGRLQHIVFATTNLPGAMEFYAVHLGFRPSDVVRDVAGEPTACFLRSDAEHHSVAFFRADSARLDHMSFESTSWNDIRDWGDHFAAQHIPIVWGAGRHGAGNNLFIFVKAPDGSLVEISAEIEHMPFETSARSWPHEERTLNLWGSAFLRS